VQFALDDIERLNTAQCQWLKIFQTW